MFGVCDTQATNAGFSHDGRLAIALLGVTIGSHDACHLAAVSIF
jgi:hypothetical protein